MFIFIKKHRWIAYLAFAIIFFSMNTGAIQAALGKEVLVSQWKEERELVTRGENEELSNALQKVESKIKEINSEISINTIEQLRVPICELQTNINDYYKGNCLFDFYIQDSNDEDELTAYIFGDLARGFDILGDYRKSIFYYERVAKRKKIALEIEAKSLNQPIEAMLLPYDGLANTHYVLGELYSLIANYEKSVEHYQLSKELQVRYWTHQKLAESSNKVTFFKGRSKKKVFEEVNNNLIRIDIREALGKALIQLHRYSEAEQELLRARENLELKLQSAEFVRRSYRSELIPVGAVNIIDSHRAIYEDLQTLHVAQGNYAKALEDSDRSRALGLLTLLEFQKTPTEVFKVTNFDFDEIKNLARNENATIVEYSIIDENSLYVYVVQPNGKIYFRIS